MYDLVIIGAGWAGFNAAIRGRECGLRVCLIEEGDLGGTCLNRGCIPTKSLIASAKIYSTVTRSSDFGVRVQEPAFDFAKMRERTDGIVRQLRSGMVSLLKDIDLVQARASFISPVEVRAGERTITARHFIIATGSSPAALSGFDFDGSIVLSSDQVLGLKAVPSSLLIIGGGVIGCEFASLFAALGCRVTVAEKMPQLLPGEDADVARKLETSFRKKGITVLTQCDLVKLNMGEFEKIAVCIGRRADLSGLNLEAAAVRVDNNRVQTDAYLKTSNHSVFAAGDCASKIMLAHFAAHQGRTAAYNAAYPAHPLKCQSSCVPGCVYTDPEVASVGETEDAARKAGRDPAVFKADYLSSGMARITGETEGFVKLLSDRATDVVTGGTIVGARATELIGIVSIAISSGMTMKKFRNVMFAHPTMSELLGDVR